jgi:hypothetical protein
MFSIHNVSLEVTLLKGYDKLRPMCKNIPYRMTKPMDWNTTKYISFVLSHPLNMTESWECTVRQRTLYNVQNIQHMYEYVCTKYLLKLCRAKLKKLIKIYFKGCVPSKLYFVFCFRGKMYLLCV